MNLLAIRDSRYPITIAIAHAVSSGKASTEVVVSWKEEFKLLVRQVTEKFIGFLTTTSVRKGLDTTLGIMSLGLLDEAKNSDDHAVWVDTLLNYGLTACTRRAVEMVKTLSSMPFTGTLEPQVDDGTSLTARDLLLQYATKRDGKGGQKVWVGYSHYLGEYRSRRQSQAEIELARWLITRATGIPASRWVHEEIKRTRRLFGDNEGYAPLGDIVINTVMLAVNSGMGPRVTMARKDIQAFKQSFKSAKDKKRWIAACRGRYEAFVEEIPAKLRPPLFHNGKDWFRRMVVEEGKTRLKGIDPQFFHLTV